MPTWKYSAEYDSATSVKASGRDLDISLKHAIEICNFIRGMKLKKAMEVLEMVIKKEVPIPFKRYNKKVAHRGNLQKWCSGRYPVKAAREILKVLKNAEANARHKGLDVDKLLIVHASSLKSIRLKKYVPRAFGRSSPWFKQYCHVEIIAQVR